MNELMVFLFGVAVTAFSVRVAAYKISVQRRLRRQPRRFKRY